MTDEEFYAYNYLKSFEGIWLASDYLISIGVTQETLDSIFSLPLIHSKRISDPSICHGLDINLADGSNYVSIVDADWLKPPDNISIRVLCKLADYTPASSAYIVSKYDGYRFYIDSDGKYNVDIKSSGSDKNYITTDAVSLTDGEYYWHRADWNYDNGSGQSSVDFKYSTDTSTYTSENIEWIDIESVTQTQHSITHSTNDLFIGGTTSGNLAQGTVLAFEVLNNDSKILEYNFSYENKIIYGTEILIDNHNNRLIITGDINRFASNTVGTVYYKFDSDFGDNDII